MKNKILVLMSSVVITILISGCAIKNNDIPSLKNELNNATRKAKKAFRDGVEEDKVKDYLFKKFPRDMHSFLDYTLFIKKFDDIAVILVCDEDRALLEDLSCDRNIDADYSSENLPCKFYIEEPKCNNF